VSNQATRLAEELKSLVVEFVSLEVSEVTTGINIGESESVHDRIIDSIDALLALTQPAVSEEAPEGFWLAPMMLDVTMLRAAAETPGMKAIDSSSATMQLRGYPLDPKAFEGGAPLAQAWIAMRDSWLARAQPSAKGDEGMQHE